MEYGARVCYKIQSNLLQMTTQYARNGGRLRELVVSKGLRNGWVFAIFISSRNNFPEIYRRVISCQEWRRGSPVVSTLDFQSEGWSFEPGLGRRFASLDKKHHSTLSHFTQVYKWVPTIIMLWGNLAME